MLVVPLFTAALAATFQLVAGASKPDVDVNVKFPETNPFGRVYNGVSTNLLQVRVANHAGEQITVSRIYGQFREAGGRQRALRNTTSVALRQPIISGQAPLMKYAFHSENKVGEVGLRVWIDYLDAGNKVHTLLGYDGNVTVHEPPVNWFDPELLLLWIIIAAVLGAGGYAAYGYFAPQPKKAKRGPKKVAATTPGTSATPAATVKGVDDEWIPAHLKAQPKSRKGYVSATSGEESEGPKKKGKGKK